MSKNKYTITSAVEKLEGILEKYGDLELSTVTKFAIDKNDVGEKIVIVVKGS